MLKTLLAAAVAAAILPAAEPRIKVILDTDIGGDIDDAWALAFVLAHEGFEPVGVTIAHGNTPLRARIACKMLHQTGRAGIPVAAGRKTGDEWTFQYAWAEDFTALRPVRQSAAEFMVEQARKHPGEITLIAVGPLENVADALRLEPGLGKLLRRVVLMSGCIYGTAGQPRPVAEYNVKAAAAEAREVYAAGLPLAIVPLDSTTHVRLTQPERQQVRAHNTPLTRALEALYRLWIDAPDQVMTLHDQLAVAEAARPGDFFGEKLTLPLIVDEAGFTRIDTQQGKPVEVCLKPKRDEFMKYYISRLVRQRLPRAAYGVQPQVAEDARHGGHLTGGRRARDLESRLESGPALQLALHQSAKGFDPPGAPTAEIGEGAVVELYRSIGSSPAAGYRVHCNGPRFFPCRQPLLSN